MIDSFLSSNITLAPLAGFTDAGFRRLAKRYGAGLTVTEMVSAKALTYRNKATEELLYCNEEGSVAVQLFGHEPEVFAQAVTLPQIQRFDVIDINMGCPVPKVFNNGEGSALMLDLRNTYRIIRACKTSGKPVSVKFRLGISDDCLAVDFAKCCCDAGAELLTVHGRTKEQMYSGRVNLDAIAKVVDACKGVKVLANGDITDVKSYTEAMQTGCYGVAIGRGALGRPYLFSLLLNKPYKFDILTSIKEHIEVLRGYKTERVIVNEMKKHICFYIKGIDNNKNTVKEIHSATSIDDMLGCVESFLSVSV